MTKTKNTPRIMMLSSADKVAGQGVGSAYLEQVKLAESVLKDEFIIEYNKLRYREITHYHSIDFHFYLHAIFGKSKTRRVGYVHFIPETLAGSIKLPKFIEKIFYKYVLSFYKKMDVLITVNPVFIDKLEELGFDRTKILYIPNFVSEKEFYPLSQEENEKNKEKFKIKKGKFTVLGVGQVQTRKGVLEFVEIAKDNPDMEFVWAGGFSFGKITDGYEKLNKLIASPPKNVKFLGIIDRSEMNALYNTCDVMFLPSFNELFPMTILETMNTYKPILLRDLSLYEDILFDFYLKENTNDGFSKELKKLKTDSDYYKKYSDKSRKGHEFYSRDHIGKLWQEFYHAELKKINNNI